MQVGPWDIPECSPQDTLNQVEQNDVLGDINVALGSQEATKIDSTSWNVNENGLWLQVRSSEYWGKDIPGLNDLNGAMASLIFSLIDSSNIGSQLIVNVGDESKASATLFFGSEKRKLTDAEAVFFAHKAKAFVLRLVEREDYKPETKGESVAARSAIRSMLGTEYERYLGDLAEGLSTSSRMDAWSARDRDLPERLSVRLPDLRGTIHTHTRLFHMLSEDGQRTEIRSDNIVEPHGPDDKTKTSIEKSIRLSRYYRTSMNGAPGVIEQFRKLKIQGFKGSKRALKTTLYCDTIPVPGMGGVDGLPWLSNSDSQEKESRDAQHRDLLKFEAATIEAAAIGQAARTHATSS